MSIIRHPIHISQQPFHFVNAATRASILGLLDSATSLPRDRSSLVASSSAGAIVGGTITGFVCEFASGPRFIIFALVPEQPCCSHSHAHLRRTSASGRLMSLAAGPRRLLPGALLWAGICGGAQWGLSAVSSWRASIAAEVTERRWLWASLTPAQRAAFAAHVASTPGLHEPGTSADARALNSIAVNDAHDPPPPRFAAALRLFASQQGIATSSMSAQIAAAAAASAGAAVSSRGSLSGSAAPATLAATEGIDGRQPQSRSWLAWLPVQFGAAAGDEARLEKMHRRLREVEELLGEREPVVDEDVKAFLAGQRQSQGGSAGQGRGQGQSLA